jgi:hypothetical protein
MKNHLSKLSSAFALLTLSVSACASPLLIDGGHSIDADCTFACVDHYQQVYGSSAFGSAPVVIRSVSFIATRYGSTWAPGNSWQISLSTSANQVDHLASAFSANKGLDNAVFDVKSFSGTPISGSAITFDGSFTYDPTKGDLLVDIVALGSTGGPGVAYNPHSNGAFSRDYSWGNSPTGSAEPGYGNVTLFDVKAASVPEPASFLLVGVGLAGLAIGRRKKSRT